MNPPTTPDDGIVRYEPCIRPMWGSESVDMEEQPDGEYVRLSDHARVVAELRALLSDVRDSVEFEVQENTQNWGDRLMHKQQPAIDLLAKIDAALSVPPMRGGAG